MNSVGYLQDDLETVLWHEMLGGNHLSFEKLLQNTYDLLFQYGKKFSKDRELIKDCIQDVFLEIWEKRASLNENIPPRAYLLASLRRRLFRQEQRHRLVSSENLFSNDTTFNIEFSVEYSFIKLEEDRRTAERITHLMNDLPKRQKEAVYLKFFQELDRDEIAAIMDIHPQSVSNLLQTAFKWLKTNWNVAISVFSLLFFR